MSKGKEEQTSYDICYSLPLALAVPFTKDQSGNFAAHGYHIAIPDIDLQFSLITPVFIGDLFQVAQKSGVELPNGDKTIVRQKVICKPLGKVVLSPEKLDALRISNINFWQALNPEWKVKMSKILDTPLGEEDITEKGYSGLRKQYLITNSFIEDNFSNVVLDNRTLSSQEIKGNLDFVYVNTRDNEHSIVLHVFENLHKISLNEFGKSFFEALFPNKPEISNPYKDLISFMMTELELKKEDLDSMKAEGSLKTFSMALSNRQVNKDLAKLVRNLRWDDVATQEEASLCITVPATSFGNFDHNKYEGIERFISNVFIKKPKARDYTKLSFTFAVSMKRTPFRVDDLDKCLRIPHTLIQLERMAQIREFKLLMDFGFIKDHLLFKALNARAIDKCNNNETLETLGDTVLKTLVSVNLYFAKDKRLDPNNMTKEKVKVINNNHLAERGRATPLLFYLKDKYQRIKDFVPPYLVPNSATKNADGDNQIYDESQIIADGMIADSVEAIIGKIR